VAAKKEIIRLTLTLALLAKKVGRQGGGHRPAGWQAGRQAGGHRPAEWQAGRQAGGHRPAGWQAGRQAGGQEGRQAGRPAGGWAVGHYCYAIPSYFTSLRLTLAVLSHSIKKRLGHLLIVQRPLRRVHKILH
jgi:hypothetical protein